MNGTYEQNESQNVQTGMSPYAAPMPGMGAGYDSLFEIIWRGKWLILLSLLLAAAGAYAYLRFATPKYESTSLLLVDKPNPQSRSDAPQPAGSTQTNYLATQAGMIISPAIVAAALNDPNVLSRPTFADPNYVKDLVKTLSADAGKKADIITVTAQSPYPEDAAAIVNAMVRAYIRWHDANRQITTADLLKDLNSQLDSRYRDLQQKRKEQMLFEQRHPEVVESTPGGMISKSLESLRDQLTATRLKVVQCDSYYQGLQRLQDDPNAFRKYVYSNQIAMAANVNATVATSENNDQVRLEEELRQTQWRLGEIQAVGGTRSSLITVLQDRQVELAKKIADLDTEFIQQHLTLAKTLLEDAKTQEQKIGEMYDKEFSKVQSLSDQDSQYTYLKSECDMMQTLCNSVLSEINQLDLSARLEGLKIYVLQRAMPAEKPSSPKAVQIVGIALALALMAGAGLAFLRDWRDQRVRSSDEITAIVGTPVLGAVPKISKRGVAARAQRLRFAANSRESEAYRAIRTALFFGASCEQGSTILVTSPSPLEGKTILVSNLGIAMAQAGRKTLILDADLRKPMQHRIFALNHNGQGLTDVLAKTITLDDGIRHSEVAGLDVLASGKNPPNPSDLLNSQDFANILEQLRKKYDCVLVDSPPVGLVADAQILAALCSVTLLVLRARKSERMATQRARDALLTVGARVAGVIVNDVSKKDSSKFSHYTGYAPPHGYFNSAAQQAGPRELPAQKTAGRSEDGPLGNYLNALLNHGPDDKTTPGKRA